LALKNKEIIVNLKCSINLIILAPRQQKTGI
jgi:hypothetical protein